MGNGNHSPNLAGLSDFVGSTDREPALFFVGRQDVLGQIERDLERRLRHWRAGREGVWQGGTWLIQGAPGAGKTALLSHLGEVLPALDERIRIIQLDASELEDLTGCYQTLANALSPGAGEAMQARVTETLHGKMDAAVFKFGADKMVSRPQQTLTGLHKRARDDGAGEQFHPVTLCIDEIQNITGDDSSLQAKFLQRLHGGKHGFPVLPVYGGLAWSKKHLFSLGISRFSDGRIHTLQPLSADECREGVQRFLRHFKVIATDAETQAWADIVARECQGWPQHLHVYLQSLAAGLLAPGADGELGKVDREAILRRTGERRISYYEDRLDSGYLHGKRYLSAAAIGILTSTMGVTPGRVMAAEDLGASLQSLSDEARINQYRLRLPEGVSGKDFADGMVRAGILHEGMKGQLTVPIPSFTHYLHRSEAYSESYEAGQSHARSVQQEHSDRR